MGRRSAAEQGARPLRWHNVHCPHGSVRISVQKYPILVLLIGVCLHPSGSGAQNAKAQKAKPQAESPVGIWRGESVCTTGAPSCHDEKVVYYIQLIPDKPDVTFIRADKIVEGKAITMGSGPWKYNRAKQTLSMESEQRLWLLNINGNRIEGTLTVPSNVIFRRMTLTKDD